METRNAISRARAAACAVIKLATFAHAISSTSATSTASADEHRDNIPAAYRRRPRLPASQQNGLIEESVNRSAWVMPVNPLARSCSKARDDGVQFRANRFHGNAWLEPDHDAMPGPIVTDHARMHHGGQENVDYGSRHRAGKWRRRDTDNLDKIVTSARFRETGDAAQVKGAADHFRIFAEAARPIVVRKHRVRMRAGFPIVVFREQPALRGPQPE